jgi:hypothetical protein
MAHLLHGMRRAVGYRGGVEWLVSHYRFARR